MLLNWNYDADTKHLTLTIDNDLYYTSIDAGKTIEKYFKSEKIAVLLHEKNIDGQIIDEWSEELKWLSDNYSHIVGKLHCPWLFGYKEKNGSIVDVGEFRGQGVISPENPISLDRLGIPAYISEWWDYDTIAFGPGIDDASATRGLVWYKHKINGSIIRTSASNCPYPDDVFPTIHGPYIVDFDDIKKHDGVFLKKYKKSYSKFNLFCIYI